MFQTTELYEVVPTCVGQGALQIEKYNGVQSTEPFHTTSTVCIFGELLNVIKGNTITSKWYAENVEGHQIGGLIGHSEIQIDRAGSYDISFCFQPPSGGWFPGDYRVEVYFDNLLKADYGFSVG